MSNQANPIVDLKADPNWLQRVGSLLADYEKIVLENYDPTEANNLKLINLAMHHRLLVRAQGGYFILEKRVSRSA